MADYDGGRVFLEVVPSFRGVQARIHVEARKWGADAGKEYRDAFDREAGRGTSVSPGPSKAQSRKDGGDSGGAFADEFRRKVTAATRALPPVRIGVEAPGADQLLRDLRLDLERLSNQTVGVDIDTAAAMAELERINAALAELDSDAATVQVRADVGAARAQLTALHQQVNALDRDDVNISVDVDTSTAASSLNTFTGRLLLLGTAGAALAPAIVPAAAAAAAALAGIGVGALAGAAGIATLVIGFQGVGDALKAMGEVQINSAADAEAAAQRQAASAASIASAQRQVENAERGLANARANAATAAEDAARRVERARANVAQAEADAAEGVERAQRRVTDARRALVRAEEDAARSIEDASRRVEDARERGADVTDRAADQIEGALRRQESAERSLADAQERSRDAQEALVRARQDAQEQIEDLAFAVENGALRERDAVIGVEEAQRRLDEVRADPEATDLERRRAQLSYEQAVQQLEQLRVRNQRLAVERDAASRAGVEGADRVVSAQRQIVDAEQAVINAQRASADAAQTVADVRVQAAEDIADAQQSLTDAVADQSRSQIDAARQIADAQRGLADAQDAVTRAQEDGAQRIADAQVAVSDAVRASAQQQQQSAFAVAGAVASVEGAQASLAQAMQRTGDVGSTSMRKLEEAMAALSPAGAAFAGFLFGLKPIWDDLKATVQAGMFPGMQAGIEALLPLMPAVTDLFGSLATALGTIAQKTGEAFASPAWRPFFDYVGRTAAPVLVTLAEAFGNIALGLANLMLAFAPLTEMFIDGLSNMADSFADWSASLGENAGFQSFLRYVQEAAPVVMDFLDSLWGAFSNLIESMAPFGPVVLTIATAFADLIAAIPPGVLGAIVLAFIGISAALSVLGPLATTVVPIIGLIGSTAGLVVGALIALGAALVAAYMHSETFRNIVNGVFRAIAAVVTWWWNNVMKPQLDALVYLFKYVVAPAAVWLWRNVLQPAFEGIAAAVKWAWDNVIRPALSALTGFVRDTLAPAISWLWRNIIEPAWAGISTAVEIAWGIIKIAFAAFRFYVREVLGPVISWLWNEIVEPAFDGIGDTIRKVWREVIKPVLNAFGNFIEDTVAPAFQRGVDAIGAAWDRIRQLALTPINFVIETVYNDGIRMVFNKIAAVVDADPLPKLDPIRLNTGGVAERRGGFATGGILPGYTPGRDVHHFYSPTGGRLELSGGEPILRPEAGRVLGSEWVHGINAAARTAGTGGVRRFLGFATGGIMPVQSFEGGGFFGDLASRVREGVQSALSSVGDFVLGSLRKTAELAFSPIRNALGGLGGGLLSGLLRGLVDRALSGILGFAGDKDKEASTLEGGGGFQALINHLRRLGVPAIVTSTFRPGDDGYHGLGKAADFSVAGHGNRGYGDPGLRAIFEAFLPVQSQLAELILAGAPFNIKNGKRVPGYAWGVPGQPGNHWNHDHAAVFDDGGRLPRGLSAVMNATGSPELVLNGQQEGMIEQVLAGHIAAPVGVGAGTGEIPDPREWGRLAARAYAGELRHQQRGMA